MTGRYPRLRQLGADPDPVRLTEMQPRGAGDQGRTRKLTQGVEALVFGMLFASLVSPDTRVLPNGLIEDDGYFYLQIAYNLGHKWFSSFDGIHLTSGYHLLWGALLGLLAMLLSIFTTSKAWFMFASVALASSVAAYTATTHFRRTWQRLFIFAIIIWSSSMTEAIILTLLVVYVFSRALRQPQEFLTSSIDSVAIALIPLARIDATIIIAVFGVSFLITNRRKFIILLASLTAGLGLQLMTMKALFGHFFSVSSMILWSRSGGPWDLHMLWRHAFDNIWSTTVHAVSGLSFVYLSIYCVSAASRIAEKERKYCVGAIVLACSSFVIPHCLLGSMREWYWTAPLLALFCVASELSTQGERANFSVLKLYCLGAIAVIAMNLAAINTVYSYAQRYSGDFVNYVNRAIPASERIFQEDASGFVGFWSKPHVINGDGMVNSSEYRRRLAANGLADYLQEEQICFIIRDWPLEDEKIVAIGGLSVSIREADLVLGPPDEVRGSSGTQLNQLKLYLLKDPRCSRFGYLIKPST